MIVLWDGLVSFARTYREINSVLLIHWICFFLLLCLKLSIIFSFQIEAFLLTYILLYVIIQFMPESWVFNKTVVFDEYGKCSSINNMNFKN